MIRRSVGLFLLGVDTLFHRIGIHWPGLCNFAEWVYDPAWREYYGD